MLLHGGVTGPIYGYNHCRTGDIANTQVKDITKDTGIYWPRTCSASMSQGCSRPSSINDCASELHDTSTAHGQAHGTRHTAHGKCSVHVRTGVSYGLPCACPCSTLHPNPSQRSFSQRSFLYSIGRDVVRWQGVHECAQRQLGTVLRAAGCGQPHVGCAVQRVKVSLNEFCQTVERVKGASCWLVCFAPRRTSPRPRALCTVHCALVLSSLVN